VSTPGHSLTMLLGMTTTLPPDTTSLAETARRMTGDGRGILAADESVKTMSSRLENEGIPSNETARRDYREVLITADSLSEWVSGVIWCDETFGQELSDGRTFPEAARDLGILPGIKVDTGTSLLPHGGGAQVTEGLDGLGARLASYAERGAAFAKWRAVFEVETITPYSAKVNGHALARYAALCQDHGIVPIVEPEVLCNGNHQIGASAQASRLALVSLFEELDEAGVDLAGVVLKPNFVTPGLGTGTATAPTVAAATFEVLRDSVPSALSGIAFLSGGHATEDVCEYLSELNAIAGRPWPVTFSYGRALVSDALRAWGGRPENVPAAQDKLLENCRWAAQATR
jgi:fructose-bisphosphate aldolase class I